MDNLLDVINVRLDSIIDQYSDSRVKDAMRYSLMAGGKRIRPVLMLQVIRSYGLDYHQFIDVACAIEMIHTYSLIHDDLPAMDDDDLRRGRLTCHKQFDEATAILAGDGLLNEAVNVILNVNIDNMLKINILKVLFQASGVNGMILGQCLDMKFEHTKANQEQLDLIHHCKTGALISASLEIGALIARNDDSKIWRELGYKIGLAFQIQDDILDVLGDSALLGKQVGSDISNDKSTYVTLMGIEKAQKAVDDCFKQALELVYGLTINHGLIIEVMEKLKKRVS